MVAKEREATSRKLFYTTWQIPAASKAVESIMGINGRAPYMNLKITQMKIKIIVLLIASIGCLANSAAMAQKIKKAAKVEMITEVKDRELIVLLKSKDETVTRKLTSSELKEYTQSIDQLNKKLETVIKEFWSFNSTIHYLTKEQIATLDHRNKHYAVIALELIDIRLANQLTRSPANQVVRLHVSLLEDYNPLKPVYYQDIVGVATKQSVPTIRKMDIIAATYMVQNHFVAKLEGKKRRGAWSFMQESQEHPGVLESKILLIDTIFLDEKLELSKIKEYYPFAIEVSNEKAIETAQTKRDRKYAYVYLFPEASAANYFYHCIIDGESGKVISYSVPNGFHMNNMVDKKHLKNYVRYSGANK